jgi:hypothetical protein
VARLPFHLIGLNTNIYYKSNGLVGPEGTDPLGQGSILRNTISAKNVLEEF